MPALMGGAIEKVWLALGKQFVARGHSVTHISRMYGNLPKEEILDGVRHLRIGGFDAPESLLKLKLLDLIYTAKALMVLPDADILVGNTFWLPILYFGEKQGSLYVHVGRFPKGQMRLYGRSARLQTVSSPIRDAILGEVPRFTSKVCVIPYPLPPSLAGHQQSYGARQNLILYTGRIHPEKGIGILIAAFTILPPEITSGWKLLIIGPAEARFGGGGEDYLSTLKRAASSIEDRVEWIGPVFDDNKLASYYRKARVFVYPSVAEKGETFGLAVLEAMANGCAPIVSALACFTDFVQDGLNGFIFDHRAEKPEQTLAATLGMVLSNPEMVGAAAKEAARTATKYEIGAVADMYLDDFARVSKQPHS